MTDGTSQGLFIVVAIVIFGIFVVLAYILFEDTLSPAMASMFDNAIEKSEYAMYPETDSSFFVFDENTGTILDYRDPDTTDHIDLPKKLVIPEQINGVTVERIGNMAFIDKGLTSAVLPMSLKSIQGGGTGTLSVGDGIRYGAFAHNQIKEIILPRSLSFIGQYAFYGNELEFIEIPGNVEIIGYGAFESNKLKEVKILHGVKEIHQSAFYINPQLVKVSLPNSITQIRHLAFSRTGLKELTVPNNIAFLGEFFISSTPLEKLRIPNKMKPEIEQNKKIISRTIYLGENPVYENEFYLDSVVEYY